MKTKEPYTSKDCDYLLNLLPKSKMKIDTESAKSKDAESKANGKDPSNKTQNKQPPDVSLPQIPVPMKVTTSPKTIIPTKSISNGDKTDRTIDKNKTNTPIKDSKNGNISVKRKRVDEEEAKHELLVEISHEINEDDGEELSHEVMKKNVHPEKHQNIRKMPEKSQSSKTNKADGKPNLQEVEEYDEDDSGSGSFYSSEEEEEKKPEEKVLHRSHLKN